MQPQMIFNVARFAENFVTVCKVALKLQLKTFTYRVEHARYGVMLFRYSVKSVWFNIQEFLVDCLLNVDVITIGYNYIRNPLNGRKFDILCQAFLITQTLKMLMMLAQLLIHRNGLNISIVLRFLIDNPWCKLLSLWLDKRHDSLLN